MVALIEDRTSAVRRMLLTECVARTVSKLVRSSARALCFVAAGPAAASRESDPCVAPVDGLLDAMNKLAGGWSDVISYKSSLHAIGDVSRDAAASVREAGAVLRFKQIAALYISLVAFDATDRQADLQPDALPTILEPFLNAEARSAFWAKLQSQIENRFAGAVPSGGFVGASDVHLPTAVSLLSQYLGVDVALPLFTANESLMKPVLAGDIGTVRVLRTVMKAGAYRCCLLFL